MIQISSLVFCSSRDLSFNSFFVCIFRGEGFFIFSLTAASTRSNLTFNNNLSLSGIQVFDLEKEFAIADEENEEEEEADKDEVVESDAVEAGVEMEDKEVEDKEVEDEEMEDNEVEDEEPMEGGEEMEAEEEREVVEFNGEKYEVADMDLEDETFAIKENNKGLPALILTPTRELAIQVN